MTALGLDSPPRSLPTRAIYLEGYLITSDISRATAIAAKMAREQGLMVIGISIRADSVFQTQLDELFGDGFDCCLATKKRFTHGTDNLDAAVSHPTDL